MARAVRLAAFAFLLAAAFSLPFAARAQDASSAQAQDDLRATIRAQILSDPRAAGLSQTQLDAMVDTLTAEARAQGLTARDITWRPAPQESASAAGDSCGGTPLLLCNLNRAFGFEGSDSRIPIGLGIAAAALILLAGLALEMRHRRAAAVSTT